AIGAADGSTRRCEATGGTMVCVVTWPRVSVVMDRGSAPGGGQRRDVPEPDGEQSADQEECQRQGGNGRPGAQAPGGTGQAAEDGGPEVVGEQVEGGRLPGCDAPGVGPRRHPAAGHAVYPEEPGGPPPHAQPHR